MKNADNNVNYERNIKVTMNEENNGSPRRTSTTIDYGICAYYFGDIMHPDDAYKAKNDKRYSDPNKKFRQWLESHVRAWAKTQPIADNRALERALLIAIFREGHRQGLQANSENLGLDI